MKRELTEEQKTSLANMILRAISEKDPEDVRNCVRLGGDVNRTVEGKPLFHNLLQPFHLPTAEAVFESVSDIDQPRRDGVTALMVAVIHQDKTAVEFLMKRGADPLVQDKGGSTSLDYARKSAEDFHPQQKARKNEIIDLLLKDWGKEQEQNKPSAATDRPIAVMKPIIVTKKPAPGGFKL